jgi:hypothetical protein
VKDLYLPDGMYHHLLATTADGTPKHPWGAKEDMEGFKKELLEQLHSYRDNAGGLLVDPEDPTITFLSANLKNIEETMTTIKASLGGEVVRIESETFHSAADVEVWLTQNMGADRQVRP